MEHKNVIAVSGTLLENLLNLAHPYERDRTHAMLN